MFANKKELVAAFCKFLEQEVSDNAVEDGESLQAAQDILKSQYSISGEDLQSSSANQLKNMFKSTEDAVGKDPKFLEFISILNSKGYFKNCTEGSEEYKTRYLKAKEKFLAKNLSASSSSASLSSIATPSTNSQQPTSEQVAEAEACKDKGNELLRQKEYNKAIEQYEKAIKLNGKNHVYHANLAAAFLQVKQYESALESCNRSILCNETYAKAYRWRGQVHEAMGELQKAVADFKKAVSLEPNNEDFQKRLDAASAKASQKTSAPSSAPNPFGGANPLASMFGGGNPFGGANPFGGGGLPNLGELQGLMGNPQFMQMAQNMMQSPMFQQMMQGMMQNMGMQTDESGLPVLSEEQVAELENLDEVKNSPKLQTVMRELKESGFGALMKYRDDPEVSEFMQSLSAKAFGGMNPFGSSGDRRGDEDGSDSSMYS